MPGHFAEEGFDDIGPMVVKADVVNPKVEVTVRLGCASMVAQVTEAVAEVVPMEGVGLVLVPDVEEQ